MDSHGTDESLVNLLVELMRYARRRNVHFGAALDSARQTYVRERTAQMTELHHEQAVRPGEDTALRTRPAQLADRDVPQAMRDGPFARGAVPPPQRNTRPAQPHRPGRRPRRGHRR
jgi:hypothetical protein